MYDLEGKKNAKIHHHDIVIPEGVHHGNYHLVVFVTDAGNETVVARNVILGAEGDHHRDHDHDHDGITEKIADISTNGATDLSNNVIFLSSFGRMKILPS